MSDNTFPTINIVGAGASGYFLAMLLAAHRVQINLFDLGKRPGRKILISGGGNCNFTNYEVSSTNYVSANAHFVKSALQGFSNYDFIAWVTARELAYHLKDDTKLFATHGAKSLLELITSELEYRKLSGKATINYYWETSIIDVLPYQVTTSTGIQVAGDFSILATGGLAMPRLKVSAVGQTIPATAQDYVIHRPGLVPLALKGNLNFYKQLSGVSLPVTLTSASGHSFTQDMLFTYLGITGPVVLNISNRWQPGENINLDLLPRLNLAQALRHIQDVAHGKVQNHDYVISNIEVQEVIRNCSARKQVKNLLTMLLPSSLIECWEQVQADNPQTTYVVKQIQPLLKRQIAQLSNQDLLILETFIHNQNWEITHSLDFDKAEVMLGGINTNILSSKTMEVKAYPGLYVIGEAMDVTGDLGGYNFQWCWSSAYACYKAILAKLGIPIQPLLN